jgi:hypothetical protein
MMKCLLESVPPRTLGFVGIVGTLACSDLSRTAFPAGLSDPDTYHTAAGAQQLYAGAVYSFTGGMGISGGPVTASINGDKGAFVHFVLESGLLTDELQAGNIGGSAADYLVSSSLTLVDSLDARLFAQEAGAPNATGIYAGLQNIRGATNQAIGALNTYAPTASPALRGHLYALEAYAELSLADLYCSGVPLSTVDFNADFTYRAGSTTTQVYEHALALLDTAVTLSTDSTRILNLAKVGKGRALLALGRYAEAAQAVTTVPTTYQYSFYVNWGVSYTGNPETLFGWPIDGGSAGATVADAEGMNGLPYLTSGDPRSVAEQYKVNQFGTPQYAPVKYGVTAPTLAPLMVASGVEARLIEAEAALQAGSTSWLTMLNALRTDGTVVSVYTRTCLRGITGIQAGSPCPAGAADTTWGPGAGIALIPAAVQADAGPKCSTSGAPGMTCTDTVWYKGLRPLTDPGTAAARLKLVFQERAYWLFLTGERQGDLRRLVRNYGVDPETVYPTGEYPIGAQLPQYGRGVSAGIPDTELRNPKFAGCLSRGA